MDSRHSTVGPPCLSVENLTVEFQQWGTEVQAIEDISFEVPTGQWVIIVGPNGSGKSTLLRTISGRIEPRSGRVRVNDRSLIGAGAAAVAARVFQVHQDPLLGTAPILTVYENLAVAEPPDSRRRESRKESLDRYGSLLEPFGLAERLRQPVKTLSGGERQLLALLIAKLRPSPLILLDEPLAALDPAKTELSLAAIAELNAMGKTLLQVTHNEGFATSLGHRTLALWRGRVVYDAEGDSRDIEELRSHWYN